MKAPVAYLDGFVAGVAWVWWFIGDGGRWPDEPKRSDVMSRWRRQGIRAWKDRATRKP